LSRECTRQGSGTSSNSNYERMGLDDFWLVGLEHECVVFETTGGDI